MSRKGTTFRTSRGIKIDIRYPEIYVEPGVTPVDVTSPAEMVASVNEGVREALRETPDIHSAFTWEKFLAEGLDAHFNARQTDGATLIEELVSASAIWTQDSSAAPFPGSFTKPAGIRNICVYGKKAIPYGVMIVDTVLPDSTDYTNIGVNFGFENGSGAGQSFIGWYYVGGGGVEAVRVNISTFAGAQTRDITPLLPATYKTDRNTYTLIVTRSLARWYINGDIVCIGILSADAAQINIAGPPYGILASALPQASEMTPFIEFGGDIASTITMATAPYRVRFSAGDREPPLVLPLYDAGTTDKFAGLTIAAGSETSHPFPAIMDGVKTLLFRADQSGTLLLQVRTDAGNWRTYNTQIDKQLVVADELFSYPMFGKAVLARVTFTPDAYPCEITDAEWIY